MAKTTLPTNYVDDVLNGAMDGKRRYREIPNADGTISLEDATTYDQVGSNFGASQLNLMSDNINQSFDANKMLKTMDEVNAVTQEGYGVDALVVKHVNESLTNVKTYVGEDGKLHFVDSEGADTVLPFSGSDYDVVFTTIPSDRTITLGYKPEFILFVFIPTSDWQYIVASIYRTDGGFSLPANLTITDTGFSFAYPTRKTGDPIMYAVNKQK